MTIFSVSFSQCVPVPGTEAIINGDFENGDDGSSTFPSLTRYDTRGAYSNAGDYTIWTNAHDFNGNNPVQVFDHTKKDGTGMMLMVDGPDSAGVCWEQHVSIFTNQTYYFSAWITSLYTANFAKVQFQVKGDNDASWSALGPLYQTPYPGVWQQVYQTWYSGTNTGATIRVVDSLQLANQWIWGNDYALDDISFINSCQKVNLGPKPQLPSSISLCDHGGKVDLNTQINEVSQETFSWFYNGVQIDTNIVKPSILSNITTTGTYTVCVDSANCIQKDTVTVVSNLKVDLGPDLNLCSPSYTYLSTNLANTTGLKLTWYKDNSILQGEHSTSLFVATPGEYKLVVADLVGNNCNASDSVHVTTSAPIPHDTTYCFAQGQISAKISVTGTGAFGWYDAATGGNKVGQGNLYNVSGLSGGDKTFYVKDTTTFNKTVFYTKPSDGNCGGGPNNSNTASNNTMLFTAKANFNINSIEFDLRSASGNLTGAAGWAGKTMNLTLRDSTTHTTITKSVPIITTKTSLQDTFRVNVGLSVVSGHKYSLQALGSGDVIGRVRVWPGGNTTCIVFPKDNGQIVFTGPGGGTNLSPGFYDWNISVGADCDRIPVRVIDKCPCTYPVSSMISPVDTAFCGSGTQMLTASCSNNSAATFLYTFYKQGTPDIVVQAASSNRQYSTSIAGTYYAVIADQTNSATCNDRTPNAVITINPLPLAYAGKDTTICSGVTVVLTATGGTTFKWSDGLGTTSTVNVSPSSNKTYKVSVTDANGCSATASVNVLVQACTCPSVQTKSVAPLCTYDAKISLDTITITTEPGTWTITSFPVGSNPGSIASNIFNAIGKDTGNYELTFMLNTAPMSICAKFSKQIVHVVSSPVANVGNSQSICSGSSATLTASGGTHYQWSTFDATNSITVKPTVNTTYTVTVKNDNGCSASNNVVVSINELPVSPDISNAIICLNESHDVTLTIKNPDASYTYEWYGSLNGNDSLNQGVSYVLNNISQAKIFYIKTITTAGCIDVRKPVTVSIGEKPQAAFNYNPVLILQSQTTVNFHDASTINKSQITSWSWLPGDNTTILSGRNATHIYNDSGQYIVMLIIENKDGCKDTAVKNINVLPMETVVVPNVFTPNSDGTNDYFIIKGIDFGEWQLIVFNRWGRKVYENNHYDNDANKWGAEGCSDGVYYYILKNATGKQTFTGYVEILR